VTSADRTPTGEETTAALARFAPGVAQWSADEQDRMRAVLAARSDEDALLAWCRDGVRTGSPLRHVDLAAIHAVREAYVWGREDGVRRP
jgi:hypothetical protein